MADSDSDEGCSGMMIDDDFGDKEEADDFYGSSDDEENVKPKKKAVVVATKKVAPKKSNTKITTMKVKASAKVSSTNPKADRVLASKENTITGTNSDDDATTVSSKNIAQREKTVEEKYQKKSQIEHILLRPDTYSTLIFMSSFSLVILQFLTISTIKLVTGSWIDATLNHQYVHFE